MNFYVCDKLGTIKEYFESLDSIYDKDESIEYLINYHKKDFTFFIGLSEDDIEDLDKPISYQDFILVEDFRRVCGGSDFYKIKRKLFGNYICYRDILEQLRTNQYCRDLLYDKDNDNIVLVDIMKKTNIHFVLMFDNSL
jgi:hypothetical protein